MEVHKICLADLAETERARTRASGKRGYYKYGGLSKAVQIQLAPPFLKTKLR